MKTQPFSQVLKKYENKNTVALWQKAVTAMLSDDKILKFRIWGLMFGYTSPKGANSA